MMWKLTVNANCTRARSAGSSSAMRVLFTKGGSCDHEQRRHDERHKANACCDKTKHADDDVERDAPGTTSQEHGNAPGGAPPSGRVSRDHHSRRVRHDGPRWRLARRTARV